MAEEDKQLGEGEAAQVEEPPAPADPDDAEVAASAPGPSGDDDAPEECPPCKGGAPGWMATFADMATLLMAFFVLLLSFSDVELPKFEQINGSLKEAFGVKRLIPSINIPMARSLIVENFSPALAQRTLIDRKQQQPLDPTKENLIRRTREQPDKFPQQEELKVVQAALAEQIERGEVQVRIQDDDIVVEFTASVSAGGPGGAGQGAAAGGVIDQNVVETAAIVARLQSQVVSEVQLHLLSGDREQGQSRAPAPDNGGNSAQASAGNADRLNEIRSSLRGEIQQGLVEVEKVGDNIVIRLAEQGSFVSGSADLAPGFLPLLQSVGQTLTQDGGRIRVEGHTDNIPVGFSDIFNSNWDLSAARSASVASYFSAQLGIAGDRMEVSGFADTRPLESNDSPQGRARNRRIEIVVEGS